MDAAGIVVGIHGLENKPPRDEKWRWWRAAVAEGLLRNCGQDGGEFPFEFVYWADLRYDYPLLGDANDEPYRPDEESGPFPRLEPGSDASLNDGIVGKVYRGLAALQTATGATPIDDAILEHRFDDLWHYHSETPFARQVRRRLIVVLEQHAGRRTLLVAHSMGSIIAYDALRMLEREAPSVRVEHLVTLGSPLGLAEVRAKIGEENGEARVPNNVDRWTNMADNRDLAAVAGELSDTFVPSDRGVGVTDMAVVNAYLRPNGSANPHKSYGYLRTPELSELVLGFTSYERADSEQG
ncbi:GPI inositol-deacylase [Methylobacterium sp. J-001]|uniref:lipase family alpha/beta hydrolase n=1 Tax=Methylobacterium sp. J-001 TaxID=2836609 RepID=UPI001FBB3355|nr:GPI inositol-deacylase [Methylobacterium sp. J-001]MCJ2118756.1 GPI inositol-deacylase [Methylobacterium sp. J-001]